MKKADLKGIFYTLKANAPSIALAVMSGWLFALLLTVLSAEMRFTKIPDFADSVSVPLLIILTLILSAILLLADVFTKRYLLVLIFPISFILYGSFSVAYYSSSPEERAYAALVFCLLAAGVIAITVNYIKHMGITVSLRDVSTRVSFVTVSVAFALMSAMYIWLLWTRKEMLCSPCFDMGIFAQALDGMKETFLPITTCERGYELSHFAVHFSPALYLLLPFSYIFEVTDLLVFAQILLVFSAVFPLWLICKRIGLSNLTSAVFSLLFLLYPAMSSGAFYDFHENAFLAPFILWTLWFIHAERFVPAFIFALGVLSVKEDAAIYVLFIALYLMLSRKKYWQGALMALMSVGYFLMASHILLSGDQGTMLSSRFFNVIGNSGGFTDLIKVLIVNPAIYAAESLNADKLLYLFNMLLPLAFLPLMTKKPSRWLLVAPLFVMNLISDYVYQYDIGFQYSFGSGALLVYLAVINFADITDLTQSQAAENEANKPEEAHGYSAATLKRSTAAALIVFALFSSVLLMTARIPSQSSYAKSYTSVAHDDVQKAMEVLDKIDKSKSIAATSMYLTYLYEADELYHLNDGTGQVFDKNGNVKLFTDVAVLDLRPYISDASKATAWKYKYMQEGYTVTHHIDGVITVLERIE